MRVCQRGSRWCYVTGVGDNVAPMLAQLAFGHGDPGKRSRARGTQSYTTVVVGPRAYEAHHGARCGSPRLLDSRAKGGARLVVQYGQMRCLQAGIMPLIHHAGSSAPRVDRRGFPGRDRRNPREGVVVAESHLGEGLHGRVQERAP